jgi:hypothetical protein
MSFKLENGLSAEPNQNEIADFWEVECLKRPDKSASILTVRKARGIGDDIQEPDDDEHDFELEETDQQIVEELDRRTKGCKGTYPFKLKGKGEKLRLTPLEGQQEFAYLYLLAATRLNMSQHRVHDGIDGARLFEEICAVVLRNYFGSRSKSVVFGTGANGGFHDKLEGLCKEVTEMTLLPLFRSKTYAPQDDDLDVVAWIPFSDGMASNLICFAQSKTGTHWEEATSELNVSAFLKRWVSTQPALDPIKAFMICDSVIAQDFRNRAVTNLLFDRCRIAEYMDFTGEEELFSRVIKWTKAALLHHQISV